MFYPELIVCLTNAYMNLGFIFRTSQNFIDLSTLLLLEVQPKVDFMNILVSENIDWRWKMHSIRFLYRFLNYDIKCDAILSEFNFKVNTML